MSSETSPETPATTPTQKKLTGAAAKSSQAKAAKASPVKKAEPATLEPVQARLDLLLLLVLRLDENSITMREQEQVLKVGKVGEGKTTFNAYNPFAKSDEKKHSVGLIRARLSNVFDLLMQANAQQVSLVAENAANAQALLESRTARVATAVQQLLLPEDLEFRITPDAGDPVNPAPAIVADPAQYTQVTSWVAPADEAAKGLEDQHFGVVCITATVPKLIDPYEALQRYLEKATRNNPEQGLTVILVHSVTTDAEAELPGVLEDKLKLSQIDGRASYSYRQLQADHVWVPQDPALLDAAITPVNGLVYVGRVMPPVKEKSK